MNDPRLKPLWGIMGDAQVAPDAVARLESNAANLLCQDIRVLRDDLPGIETVAPVYALCLVWRQARGPFKVDHQLVDALVLGPAPTDHLRAHRTDAGHLFQIAPALLKHLERVRTKVCDEGLRVMWPESFDASSGQIPLDGREATRRLRCSVGKANLQAILGIAPPGAIDAVASTDADLSKGADCRDRYPRCLIGRHETYNGIARLGIGERDVLYAIDALDRLTFAGL